ncbi:MAG TPA: DUF4160 domain-containing protein, partial [Thermoanaerobaculia bacterium]
ARYGAENAAIEIDTLTLIAGSLPPRALGLVVEWGMLHRDELRQDWQLARDNKVLRSIAPLQ